MRASWMLGKSSVSGRFLMRQLSAVSFCSVFFVFYCDVSFQVTVTPKKIELPD